MLSDIYHHAWQNSMHAHWIIINRHSHSNSHGHDVDEISRQAAQA